MEISQPAPSGAAVLDPRASPATEGPPGDQAESERRRSLSPSRAAEFKTCPQLFKFRHVDRIPEPLDPMALRGSLVHLVLEELFRLPPQDRTHERALTILEQAWELLKPSEPGMDQVEEEIKASLTSEAVSLLGNYFRVEDPGSLDIHQLEWAVEHPADGLLLRGIIDRVEVTGGGEWVLTDYKTGRSPSDAWAMTSFFGLRFYALICWRAFGRIPAELRLVHLREPEVLTLVPTVQMLEGLERQVQAISKALGRAYVTGRWGARTGAHCSWCPHRALCPAWHGGPGEPAS